MDRKYNFFIRSYCLDLSFLNDNIDVKRYAYIIHDKDVKPDGTLDKPHTHVVVQLKNACTLSALIKRQFIDNQYAPHYEVCKSVNGAFEYLTHDNDLDKIQYDKSAIVSNDIEYFLSSSKSSEDKNAKTFELLEDLHNGVDLKDMVLKYGRDFVINYNKYKFFSSLMFGYNFSLDDENKILLKRLEEHEEFIRNFKQDELIPYPKK